MAKTRYAVNQYPIQILLSYVQSGEVAIPEIQRPFVWDAAQVRDLLDSLYRGYPIGYLISWRNPDVRLKTGGSSTGKKILIDGQQRITALMAAVLGYEVMNKHYRRVNIRIAFNPMDEIFEVSNPAIYLLLREAGMLQANIETYVRKAYVLNVLTERFAGNPEGTFDFDIRRINEQGFESYFRYLQEAELGESFWQVALPKKFNTPVASSPFFRLFLAAQSKMGDLGFLSKAITVRDMVIHRGDRHHIYPKNYLKKLGYPQSKYNQIANYTMTQAEINIAIGDMPPEKYFSVLTEGIQNDHPQISAIDSMDQLQANLEQNCIPYRMFTGDVPLYEDFLVERQVLLAKKLKQFYEGL